MNKRAYGPSNKLIAKTLYEISSQLPEVAPMDNPTVTISLFPKHTIRFPRTRSACISVAEKYRKTSHLALLRVGKGDRITIAKKRRYGYAITDGSYIR